MEIKKAFAITAILGAVIPATAEERPIIESMYTAPHATAEGLKAKDTPEDRIWLGYMVATGLVSESTYGSASVIYRQALDDYYRDNIKDGQGDDSLWSGFNFGERPFVDSVRQQIITSPSNLNTLRGLFDLVGGAYIPCALFKAKKAEAFNAFGANWGGGRDFAMQFCTEDTVLKAGSDVEKYVNALTSFTGPLSSSNSDGSCWLGTLYRDRQGVRHKWFAVLAYVPPLKLEEYDLTQVERLDLFLKYWALKETTNWDFTYKKLPELEKQAKEELSGIYQHQGYSRAEASQIAHNAIQLIRADFLGSFPSAMDDFLVRLRPVLENPESMLNNLDSVKDTDMRDALMAYAVVSGKSPDILAKLGKISVEQRQPGLTGNIDWGESLLAKARNVDQIEWLLGEGRQGFAVNKPNGFGKTPLMYAIQRNDKASVEQLLDNDASPNQPTTAIETLKAAEDYAYCEQYYELKAGVRTPLMYAAWHADAGVVQVLLEHKAKPQLTDDNGDTACAYIDKNEIASPDQKQRMKKLLCKQ